MGPPPFLRNTMSYQIDASKVAGVVIEANFALNDKGFNHGEVILGLSELIGRVIVESCDTSIQAGDMMKVCMAHIEKTITIGSHATGKSIIARA